MCTLSAQKQINSFIISTILSLSAISLHLGDSMQSNVGVFVRKRERERERKKEKSWGRVCTAVERARNQYSVCTDGDSVEAEVITGLQSVSNIWDT